MQFSLRSLVLLAALGLQTHVALADCGSTCYNPAGSGGCLSTAFGESYCNAVFPGKSACIHCVDVNCGGYGSKAELADKAFCAAEGYGKVKERRGTDLIDWTVELDSPTIL